MWRCQKCREYVEDTFEVCWSCGTSRDGREDPSFRRADEVEAASAEVSQPAAAAAEARRRQGQSTCPKCGARQVIPDVRVLDRDEGYTDKSLSVRLDRNPGAWIFKGAEVVELRAVVCGRCGYAELYATDPAALWSAYEAQAQSDPNAPADRPRE